MVMVESLYFSCYYAYLLGDLDQTQMYFEFLKDEFKTHGPKEFLKDHQLKELASIREAINTGVISKNKWIDSTIAPEIDKAPDIDQVELVKRIHLQGLGQLRQILGDDIRILNVEQPCPPYGRVDMVYKSKNTIYPIEVKRAQGQHDLIGQISKYDLYHRLRLHFKHYEFVRSVTICSSYNQHTLDELKSMGIKTLMYSTDDGLKIRSI